MMSSVSFQVLLLVFFSTFLYFHDTIKLCSCHDNLNTSSCTEIERKALLNFKSNLSDPSGMLKSWIGEDCCRWKGVRCTIKTNHVISLNLRNPNLDDFSLFEYKSGLGGKISSSLIDLKHLSYFDLSGNRFEGKIPDFFGSFKNLRYLNLSFSFNVGSIPQSFHNLSNLQYLDLDSFNGYYEFYNSSKIEIESDLKWVSGLTSLKYLNLGSTNLSGASSYWLQAINTLPSLLELHLHECSLQSLPSSLPYLNFTSLSVLDLSTNGFNSTIPQWLFNLTSLTQLDLSYNYLRGEIPDAFSKLSYLESLDMFGNVGIEGKLSTSLEKLCNLKYLDLSANKISGDLNNFIGSLSQCSKNNSFHNNNNNLRYLSLSYNKLSGSIPATIGNLSSLKSLDLSNNKMSGNISKNLGQLSSLEYLFLSGNPWEGIITEDHLRNLSSLRIFAIGIQSSPNISLVFKISHDWVPPFKLRSIRIWSCGLFEFPKWIKNQTELKSVTLNSVSISGTIPEWFLKLNHTMVDLSSNDFVGPLPLWSSNLRELHLKDNLFSGPIPMDFGIRMPNLEILDVSNNLLDGSIPDIWDKMKELEVVVMSNNNLIGSIPSSFGSIDYLGMLRLSGNNLSGEIPSSFKNCTKLEFLDIGDNQISGKLPPWIGVSMSLFILRFRNNSLVGNIPFELCSLSKLHLLDLSKNNFSGPIPPCIGNMSGFTTTSLNYIYSGSLQVVTKGSMLLYGESTLYLMNSIDLSENELSGEIPTNITALLKLVNLNLSMNHLTGMIPSDIGNLKVLESLDLSVNKLSGPIPTTMASLTFLNHLNLSHNNLSGYIPTSNQFQSFNDPSTYTGNAKLCGKPLTTTCGNENSGPSGDKENGEGSKKEDDDNEDDLDKLKFFVAVGMGLFVGFWGFFGTLIMKKNWRYAYFNYLQRMEDKICDVLDLN